MCFRIYNLVRNDIFEREASLYLLNISNGYWFEDRIFECACGIGQVVPGNFDAWISDGRAR